jgi:hypothetical protein
MLLLLHVEVSSYMMSTSLPTGLIRVRQTNGIHFYPIRLFIVVRRADDNPAGSYYGVRRKDESVTVH